MHLSRSFFSMLLRRLVGAALGIYGPPEVLLSLSVIPERLIHRKAAEGGGKIPSFLTLKLAFRAAKLLVYGAESV